MVSRKDLTKSNDIKDPLVLKYCSELILRYNALLNMRDTSSWTCAQVIEYLTNESDDVCFSTYAKTHINRMINCGQDRNARNYKMALQHLELFMGTNQIMFSQLTSTNVIKWVQSLESTKRAKEMYPICIRQIFKAATLELNDYDNGMIRIKTNPWPKVKIPKADRAQQRAISPDACRAFFAAPCPDTGMVYPTPELGHDVAKMVLCLAGINTVDLYNLKKKDYHNGIICYQRAKTAHSRSDGAYFEMRVEPFILPLFEKYKAADDDPYLFSFHKRYCDSDSFCANANNGIKKICKSMGIPQDNWYCVYTFRHSWATIAQNDCDARLEDVGFAMNHSQRSTRVTRGYVKIDFTPAWELNAKVIDFVFFSNKKGKLGKARDIEEPQDKLFRISPKMMMYARAYFRGEVLSELTDIGFNTVDDVIKALASKLPASIPDRASVQFRIKNVDTDKEAIYERTKGKGF